MLFEGAANELAKSIEKFTVKGKVVPARLKTLLNRVNEEMAALRPHVAGKIRTGMKNSVNYGIKAGMRGVEKVLPARLKLGVGSSFIGKDGAIRMYDAKIEAYADSVWAKISGDAMDALMRFKPAGITLSDRVWDISWQAEKAIRNRIQMGVLEGESAARLSRDIRGYLIRPETLRGRIKKMYTPGKGVYKSAYKNAMRVTRTEYARAYTEGTYRYGAQKDWIKGYYWRVASGMPCPICADLDGAFFPKEEPPPIPAHPHCFCYAEIVMDETRIKEQKIEKFEPIIKGIIEERLLKMNKERWKREYKSGTPHWATDKEPSPLAKRLLDILPNKTGNKILEIGVGNGRDSIFLAEEGNKVIGIDIAEGAIKLAKESAVKGKVGNVTFEIGNVEKLKYSDEKFDAVYSISVLHSTILKDSLKEVARVLKPEGKVLLYLYEWVKDKSKKYIFYPDKTIRDLAGKNELKVESLDTEIRKEAGGVEHKILVYEMQKNPKKEGN